MPAIRTKETRVARAEERLSAPGSPSAPDRRRVAIAGALAVPLLYAAYRIFTFVPQPLDSPGTLRPVLYSWFSSFVGHYASVEEAQRAWASYSLLLLMVPVFLALANYVYSFEIFPAPKWVGRIVASRTLLFSSIAAGLVAFRFPYLLAAELNPDETQFLAAAHKLFKDPVFFRSVDCGTSGPVNIFPLMLPAVFGISPDYASGRVVALLIILASIFVMYRVFSLVSTDSVARVALLPMVGAFAVMKDPDWVHYSSEQPSLLLIALSLYAAVRTFRAPSSYATNLGGLGVLLACASLAKLQTVPIIVCITAITLAWVHKHSAPRPFWRPYLMLGYGLAPLLLMNLIVCVATGVLNDFWTGYLVMNLRYGVTSGRTLSEDLPRFIDFALHISEIHWMTVTLAAILAAYVFQVLRGTKATGLALFLAMGATCGISATAAESLLRFGWNVFAAYGGVLAMFLLGGAFLLILQERDVPSPVLRWFGFAAWASLLTAGAVAYAPHRLFEHYLLLMIIPLSLVTAWPIVRLFPRPEISRTDQPDVAAVSRPVALLPFVLMFLALTATGQVVEANSPGTLSFWSPPTIHAPESDLIESLVPPTGEISVWGWNARPYVGAGRAPATRDTNMSNFFRDNEHVANYSRERYLKDLVRHPADLFVDASMGERGNWKVQLVPSIDFYVRSNYVYVTSAYGEDFYIRNDLARSVAGIAEWKACDPRALRCYGARPPVPAELPPVQMPSHAILEITFTPEMRQDPYATVFSNDDMLPAEHHGFQFQAIRPDTYRLAIGVGSEWVFSHDLTLPLKKPVALAVEFNGSNVTLTIDGTKRDEIQLPERMADSAGTITLGSWNKNQRPFVGNIQFFQIRDLGAAH